MARVSICLMLYTNLYFGLDQFLGVTGQALVSFFAEQESDWRALVIKIPPKALE